MAYNRVSRGFDISLLRSLGPELRRYEIFRNHGGEWEGRIIEITRNLLRRLRVLMGAEISKIELLFLLDNIQLIWLCGVLKCEILQQNHQTATKFLEPVQGH